MLGPIPVLVVGLTAVVLVVLLKLPFGVASALECGALLAIAVALLAAITAGGGLSAVILTPADFFIWGR